MARHVEFWISMTLSLSRLEGSPWADCSSRYYTHLYRSVVEHINGLALGTWIDWDFRSGVWGMERLHRGILDEVSLLLSLLN